MEHAKVYEDGGGGIRRIVECFGSLNVAVGRRVRYHKDWLGVLEWFKPLEEN